MSEDLYKGLYKTVTIFLNVLLAYLKNTEKPKTWLSGASWWGVIKASWLDEIV